MYAALGDRDRAFAWLDQAARSFDPVILHLKVDPRFDKLRGDARFAKLLATVGLSQCASAPITNDPTPGGVVSDNLSNFLVDLASDPARMDAFLSDPSAVLNQSVLSEDERAAVLTRDGRRIREALHIMPWEAALPEGAMAKRPPTPKAKPKPSGKPGKKK